uniref:Lipoprotein n=1 Tax=Prevotella sp. Sc00044 TaxID=1231730 RepID=W5QT18_9BACT|nr:hypothetical protein [Prevotella sp. Sc00044]
MKRLFPLLIVLATLLSCNPGSDELNAGNQQLNPTEVPTLDYSFKGVWTVDNVKGDETYTRVATNYMGNNYVACEAYPFAAIMDKFLPEVKVAKFTANAPYGSTPSAEEELWMQTMMNHDSNRCLESFLAVPYRCIGYSEQSIYLEMMPSVTYGTIYLPFVVTKEDGTLMAVVLTIAPTESTALLDRNGTSFTNILTVTQIETIIDGQSEVKTLSPMMQLKFTSIERVK